MPDRTLPMPWPYADPQTTPDAADDEERIVPSGLNKDILIEGLKMRREYVRQAKAAYGGELERRDQDIRAAIYAHVPYRDIAEALGVSIGTVANVRRKNP